jgi:predicted HNH restriction endonuclease
MKLRDSIEFSYTQKELRKIPGVRDEMASYWLKINDSNITDSSVCWLYGYALNGGSHRGKAQAPSRQLFDSIFDFDFNEFQIYVVEKGTGSTSKAIMDESWWAAIQSRRYNKNFLFENDFIVYTDNDDDPFTSSGMEGGKKQVYSTKYERQQKLREAAIKIHGLACKVS